MSHPPLAAEDHRCADCDLHYAELSVDAARAMIAAIGDRASEVCGPVPAATLRIRPLPGAWSALEYLCHLRDVHATATIRLHRMRTEEGPSLEPMLNDLRARRFRYNELDPGAVLDELHRTAAGFLDEITRVAAGGWDRGATRLPDEWRTARWLVRHTAHEGIHHLADIRRLLAAEHPGFHAERTALSAKHVGRECRSLDGKPFRPGIGANRDAFDVPTEIAYFNTANLAPLLHSVRSAGDTALGRRARPWTIAESDWFDEAEQARALFGELVGTDPDGVALVPSTSYGLAVAANNLPLRAGDRIVVLAEEYPSGIYTWREAAGRSGAEIHTVSRVDGQSWTEAVLAALDDRVAVVSVPQVHWTDGALVELDRVAAAARGIGACLVVDASQSVGAIPLDVGTIRPDFLVSVGYKWLLGPFGLGYLYVADEHRNGTPLEQNWILRANARDFAGLVDYCDDYQPGSRRYDVGERTHFETMPMAVAALRQLVAWRVPVVAAALAEVTARIAAGARDLGLAVPDPTRRGPHLLGITLPPDVRSAALTALASAGCHVALRGGALRIAPHLHVTAADVDTLLHALSTAVRAAPR